MFQGRWGSRTDGDLGSDFQGHMLSKPRVDHMGCFCRDYSRRKEDRKHNLDYIAVTVTVLSHVMPKSLPLKYGLCTFVPAQKLGELVKPSCLVQFSDNYTISLK